MPRDGGGQQEEERAGKQVEGGAGTGLGAGASEGKDGDNKHIESEAEIAPTPAPAQQGHAQDVNPTGKYKRVQQTRGDWSNLH